MSRSKHQGVSLEDRLAFGNLTVQEVQSLKMVSNTKFYSDLKDGLVSVRKIGSKTVVPGPIAARYIAGEPIGEVA